MKKSLASLSALTLALAAGAAAQPPDDIGGVAKADFANNLLTIPCVQLENFGGKNEGKFFDVILERRGNSFNYELSVAQPEDAAFCQRLADFANFEDDDLVDDEDDADAPRLLLQCELREDRSIVSVKGRNLEQGDYSVNISSGTVTVETDAVATDEDEVEFDFDSDPGDVAEGDIEISALFIVDDTVEAELLNAAGDPVLTATATCLAE